MIFKPQIILIIKQKILVFCMKTRTKLSEYFYICFWYAITTFASINYVLAKRSLSSVPNSFNSFALLPLNENIYQMNCFIISTKNPLFDLLFDFNPTWSSYYIEQLTDLWENKQTYKAH